MTERRDYGRIDWSRVDPLAVEFACNSTPMELNADEQVVAVRAMLGKHTASEIARRIGSYAEMVNRIAKTIEETALCPYCRQRVYHHAEGTIVSRHVDVTGLPWCPQSNQPRSRRIPNREAMRR